jgi:hypothetical protein
MKEGRRVIVPTARQMAEAARKKAEASLMVDAQGLSGRKATVKDLAGLERYVENTLKLSKQRQKEILERGEATDEYLTLRLIQILKDEKDGKVIDELNGSDKKTSLQGRIDAWRGGDIEMLGMWDKNNRFIGFRIGKETEVESNYIEGNMAGGTMLHNHPVKEEKGERLGNPCSGGDVSSFRDSGAKASIVTTKEGVFYLERNGPTTIKDIDITRVWERTKVKYELSAMLYRTSKTMVADDFHRLIWRDIHEANKELARLGGYTYRFVPNKGYESLTDKTAFGKLPD